MPPSIPIATYRLQLTSDFGFDNAAALVPYLKAVGISHLYSSPFLKARAGSTHGYDVVEHNSLNPELGIYNLSDGTSVHVTSARLLPCVWGGSSSSPGFRR